MNTKFCIISLFLFLSIYSQTKLRVVASVPDLADIAREIGGDRVNVITLATGREDLHAVPVRPSFLPKLNKADILLCLGLDAEHAWLPAIAAEARNPRIREDGPGWIDCSKGIGVLGKPVKLDRSEGEQHPQGNPHYNIGPQCGTTIAENIYKAFLGVMPDQRSYFQKNKDTYIKKVDSLVLTLREKGKALENVVVIEYHPDLVYLTTFYKMKEVGSIEPKAGIAPTTGHLKRLSEKAKTDGVQLIIYNQSQNPEIPVKLASETGCSAVQIANAVNAQESIRTWIDLQIFNCNQLLNALHGKAQ
jgi:zinc/manganese transport system substrate-binding protein